MWAVVLCALLACSQAFDITLESSILAIDPTKDSLNVNFSLTNTATEPLTFLVWDTPFDQSYDVMRSDMFDVVHSSGEHAVYIGIKAKRHVLPSDLMTLRGGQTARVSLDLLKGYWFPRVGSYSIKLASTVKVYEGTYDVERVTKQGLVDWEVVDLVSETLTVSVVNVVSPPSWMDSATRAVTPLSNCDATQSSTLGTVDRNAATLASQVSTYLTKTCSTAAAYVTWFGACDTTRYSTVNTHFTNIRSRISSGYRVDCKGPSCSANTYAYVYPTDTTYTVYVCGAFWSANVSTCAYDSKPGTIVHELSHFNSVAGTSDNAYGTSACQSLAKSNPSSAVNNADSHEYMAENCA